MNKIVSGLFIIIVFIISASVFINRAEAQTVTPIPIRKFTISLDASVTSLGTLVEQKVEGRLKEYANGSLIKDWKVNLQKKGHNRSMCEPIMFNLSFDKTDSSGNKRPLFNGRTTYSKEYPTLEYQELRFVPDCDTWNDYAAFGDIGFGGSMRPHMREGFIYSMFRTYGIATPEIVGFADITFVSSDAKYDGRTFRYMILQRADEQDDQIPLTKQFGLNSFLYESGDTNPYWIEWEFSNRLSNITLLDPKSGIKTNLSLDTANSAKLMILTDFIGLYDTGYLHNESYGTKVVNNKTIIIPHGFDASMSCYVSPPQNTTGGYYLSHMKSDDPIVNKIYFDQFNLIFNNINNLYLLERLADNLPGSTAEKTKLKAFLRLRFHQFATYAISPEFARAMKQPWQPRTVSLPFTSEESYTQAYNAFMSTCISKTYRNDVFVRVTPSAKLSIAKVEENFYGNQFALKLSGKMEVKVINKGAPLKLRKNAGFSLYIMNENGKILEPAYPEFWIPKPQGVIDEIGPYYILPANSIATYQLDLASYIKEKDAPYGTELYLVLRSFDANSGNHAFYPETNISTKLFVNYPAPVTPPPTTTVEIPKIRLVKPNTGGNWVMAGKLTDTRSGFESNTIYIDWVFDNSPIGHTYSPNEVQAFLKIKTNDVYQTIGRIPSFGIGSIYWVAGIVSTNLSCVSDISYSDPKSCNYVPNLKIVPAGKYYITLKYTKNNIEDVSDLPINLLTQPLISTNDSDGNSTQDEANFASAAKSTTEESESKSPDNKKGFLRASSYWIMEQLKTLKFW